MDSLYIVMVAVAVFLLFANFFLKQWVVAGIVFFLSCGVILMPEANQWLQYGFILLMGFSFYTAVKYAF